MRKRSSAVLVVMGVVMLLVVGVLLWGIINRAWLMDWWRGMGYEPSVAMGRIRDSLGLTERGEFLFRASRPELSESEQFNAVCRGDQDEEMAVLGCYTNQNIYVYNIESVELDGIRELTTAHELLHAVWERMSEAERQDLNLALKQAYNLGRDYLVKELETYDEGERQEELFVRAGTEVADLPAELEKVYGEIFKDQDAVVAYYNKYIAVFRAMEQEMENLKAEMERIDAEIESKTAEYERRIGQLNADIVSFNACADVEGCFKSDAEFYTRRSALVAEQNALEAMYREISELVDEYNQRVARYNADVTRTEKLNTLMNSSKQVEEL